MAPSKKELRKFGLLVGAIFAAWASYRIFRRGGSPVNYAVGSGGTLLLVLGALAPRVLGPLYLVWMRLAGVLGWINTRILLGVMFFVVVTPIAFFARVFGHDPLDRRPRRRPPPGGAGREVSYWRDHEDREEDPERYKRQF